MQQLMRQLKERLSALYGPLATANAPAMRGGSSVLLHAQDQNVKASGHDFAAGIRIFLGGGRRRATGAYGKENFVGFQVHRHGPGSASARAWLPRRFITTTSCTLL